MSPERKVQTRPKNHPTHPSQRRVWLSRIDEQATCCRCSALSSSHKSIYKSASGWTVGDTDLSAAIMPVNSHVLVDLCSQRRE